MASPRAPGKSLTRTAYERLRGDLIGGRMTPGGRMNIVELAATLGVSPGAIREALSRLTAEGLVVAEPQKGFQVAPISVEDLHELTAARTAIEALCVRRALEVGGIRWESQLVAAHHELSHVPLHEPHENAILADDWSVAHAAFHEALVSACDNRYLLDVRRSLYARGESYRRLSSAASLSRDVGAEHDAIVAAVLARDLPLLEKRLAAHFQVTMHAVERALFTGGSSRGGPRSPD